MRKFFVFFILISGLSAVTFAQSPKHNSTQKWDIFAGYSFSRASVINDSPFPLDLNGGMAAAAYYPVKHVGALAEFADYTDNVHVDGVGVTFKTQGYLFGPIARYGFKHDQVSVFAQQTFGVTHLSMKANDGEECREGSLACTSNPFTMTSGGGVDLHLNKLISIRPMQMEYFTERLSPGDLEGVDDGGLRLNVDGFRYSAGAVLHF